MFNLVPSLFLLLSPTFKACFQTAMNSVCIWFVHVFQGCHRAAGVFAGFQQFNVSMTYAEFLDHAQS